MGQLNQGYQQAMTSLLNQQQTLFARLYRLKHDPLPIGRIVAGLDSQAASKVMDKLLIQLYPSLICL